MNVKGGEGIKRRLCLNHTRNLLCDHQCFVANDTGHRSSQHFLLHTWHFLDFYFSFWLSPPFWSACITFVSTAPSVVLPQWLTLNRHTSEILWIHFEIIVIKWITQVFCFPVHIEVIIPSFSILCAIKFCLKNNIPPLIKKYFFAKKS